MGGQADTALTLYIGSASMDSDGQQGILKKLKRLSPQGRSAVEDYIEFLFLCERTKEGGGSASRSEDAHVINAWGDPEDTRR